ncbi:methyltransferase [Gordonia phage Gudmit]|nr:methyltransferase [Gordonia phage Gudmit]
MSEPYYSDDLVTLYHGDCREVLLGMDEKSVDAVITDPPYTERTHGAAKTNRGKGHGVKAVDFAAITDEDLRTVLAECGRVTARWVITSLDYAHAFAFDQEPPTGLRSLRIGVWVKPNPMPQISADRPGQGWEAISFLHRADTKPAWNGGGKAGVWTHPVVQNTGHPTSKPLPMVEDWVRLFTNPGETVFDPFAGSGTTLIAAANENRRAIGVELEERYCELIAKRLSNQTMTLNFGAPL